jgi:hypothetical protein
MTKMPNANAAVADGRMYDLIKACDSGLTAILVPPSSRADFANRLRIFPPALITYAAKEYQGWIASGLYGSWNELEQGMPYTARRAASMRFSPVSWSILWAGLNPRASPVNW